MFSLRIRDKDSENMVKLFIVIWVQFKNTEEVVLAVWLLRYFDLYNFAERLSKLFNANKLYYKISELKLNSFYILNFVTVPVMKAKEKELILSINRMYNSSCKIWCIYIYLTVIEGFI